MSRENDLRLLVFTELRDAERQLYNGNRGEVNRAVSYTLKKLIEMSGYKSEYEEWRKLHEAEY